MLPIIGFKGGPMVISSNYEIVDVAGECLAVPVRENAVKNKHVFSFSRAAGFLIKQLKSPKSKEELVQALLDNFEVGQGAAKEDVDQFISTLYAYGLLDNKE